MSRPAAPRAVKHNMVKHKLVKHKVVKPQESKLKVVKLGGQTGWASQGRQWQGVAVPD